MAPNPVRRAPGVHEASGRLERILDTAADTAGDLCAGQGNNWARLWPARAAGLPKACHALQRRAVQAIGANQQTPSRRAPRGGTSTPRCSGAARPGGAAGDVLADAPNAARSQRAAAVSGHDGGGAGAPSGPAPAAGAASARQGSAASHSSGTPGRSGGRSSSSRATSAMATPPPRVTLPRRAWDQRMPPGGCACIWSLLHKEATPR